MTPRNLISLALAAWLRSPVVGRGFMSADIFSSSAGRNGIASIPIFYDCISLGGGGQTIS